MIPNPLQKKAKPFLQLYRDGNKPNYNQGQSRFAWSPNDVTIDTPNTQYASEYVMLNNHIYKRPEYPVIEPSPEREFQDKLNATTLTSVQKVTANPKLSYQARLNLIRQQTQNTFLHDRIHEKNRALAESDRKNYTKQLAEKSAELIAAQETLAEGGLTDAQQESLAKKIDELVIETNILRNKISAPKLNPATGRVMNVIPRDLSELPMTEDELQSLYSEYSENPDYDRLEEERKRELNDFENEPLEEDIQRQEEKDKAAMMIGRQVRRKFAEKAAEERFNEKVEENDIKEEEERRQEEERRRAEEERKNKIDEGVNFLILNLVKLKPASKSRSQRDLFSLFPTQIANLKSQIKEGYPAAESAQYLTYLDDVQDQLTKLRGTSNYTQFKELKMNIENQLEELRKITASLPQQLDREPAMNDDELEERLRSKALKILSGEPDERSNTHRKNRERPPAEDAPAEAKADEDEVKQGVNDLGVDNFIRRQRQIIYGEDASEDAKTHAQRLAKITISQFPDDESYARFIEYINAEEDKKELAKTLNNVANDEYEFPKIRAKAKEVLQELSNPKAEAEEEAEEDTPDDPQEESKKKYVEVTPTEVTPSVDNTELILKRGLVKAAPGDTSLDGFVYNTKTKKIYPIDRRSNRKKTQGKDAYEYVNAKGTSTTPAVIGGTGTYIKLTYLKPGETPFHFDANNLFDNDGVKQRAYNQLRKHKEAAGSMYVME